jgi:hypothetical protein
MNRNLTVLVLAFVLLASACGRQQQSPATQTAQAAQAAPRPTPPARPSRPSPDRSTPLDRYTPVADAHTLRLLQLAFAPGPVSDDDKLALVPEAQNVADAFARRDLAATALPALNSSLDTERANRYRRMDVDTNGPGPNDPNLRRKDPSGLLMQWWIGSSAEWGGPLTLGPYDLAAKGFPMPCPASSTVYTVVGNIGFRPEASAPSERCFLPVADEAVARRIESMRAAGGRFPLKASLSFFFAGSTGNQLDAVLTHLDLTLLDPGDRTGATPLARVSFDP